MGKRVLYTPDQDKRITRVVREAEQTRGQGPLHRGRPGATYDMPTRFGKVVSDWAPGQTYPNQIEINPCLEGGNSVDTNQTVTLYLWSNSIDPTYANIHANDIVQYVPFWSIANQRMEGLLLGIGLAGTKTTPAVLGPSDPTTNPEAAETDTWDRANPPAGKDGGQMALFRPVYNAAGDKVLYCCYRIMTWDSEGKITDISAETQYTIDAPEACP